MKVYLSRLHFPVTTLGVGRRIGIWFQGCSIGCPGCVSKDTWEGGRGGTTLELIINTIEPWLNEADGVTISGGEPFDQPEALKALLQAIRGSKAKDILVYSGYAWERIEPTVLSWGDLIDVVISDPFDPKATQTLIWRGSDNQRMHLLTLLGGSLYRDWVTAKKSSMPRALDVFFQAGEVWMAGIPEAGDMKAIQASLVKAGYGSTTSESATANFPIFA